MFEFELEELSFVCECCNLDCGLKATSATMEEFGEWVDPDHDNRDLILKDHLQYYEEGTYTILYERDDFMVIQVEGREEVSE